MIIGSGLIAKAFTNSVLHDGVVVFASGVSNSKNADIQDFNREFGLLEDTFKTSNQSLFIYFSTASIDDPALHNSPYVLHKKRMEQFIQDNFSEYLILRVSNVVGRSGNPNTIFNFIKGRIENNQRFELWTKAYRNLLDVEDLVIYTEVLVREGIKNRIEYAFNPNSISMPVMVALISEALNQSPEVELVDLGGGDFLNKEKLNPLIFSSGLNFGDDYYRRIITKYIH